MRGMGLVLWFRVPQYIQAPGLPGIHYQIRMLAWFTIFYSCITFTDQASVFIRFVYLDDHREDASHMKR